LVRNSRAEQKDFNKYMKSFDRILDQLKPSGPAKEESATAPEAVKRRRRKKKKG